MTNFRRFFALCLVLLGLVPLPPVAAQNGPESAPAAPRSTVFLPLVSGGTGSTQQRTSDELIAEAAQAGTISSETALLYQTYVVFNDARLPAQFRGTAGSRHDDGTGVMTEIRLRWNTLSPATQAALLPFTLRPDDPASWFVQNDTAASAGSVARSAAAVQWATVDTATSPITIWYHADRRGDAARARVLAAELDRTIWPRLTKLLRAPLPDCGETCAHGGGDTRLDIYLVNERIGRSYVQPETQPATSSFMVLRRNVSFSVVAHELMHMIQFAYPISTFEEYRWAAEATAEWAMHYVYPKATNDPDYPETDPEHSAAPWYLIATHESLTTLDSAHEYGAYLYFFFLNNPAAVKAFWEQSIDRGNSLEALNAVTPGGLTATWPTFMLANWNRAPVMRYREQDGLEAGALARENIIIGADGRIAFEPFELPYLSGRFQTATFNDDARQVTLENPFTGDEATTGQWWVIPSIDGVPQQPQNWTSFGRKRFCRDEPGQNLTSVVIVAMNTEWRDRLNPLEVNDMALETAGSCGRTLRGSVTYEASQNFNSSDASGASELRTTQTLVMQVRLRYDEAQQQYVDDGSTYSLNGSHYDTSLASAPGSVRSTFEWTESGGGTLGDRVGAYIDRNADGTQRLMLGVDSVPYQVNGTVTYTPPGQVVPVERDEALSPICNDYNDLPSQPAQNNAAAFDMQCSQSTTTNAGSSTVKVTGTISAP